MKYAACSWRSPLWKPCPTPPIPPCEALACSADPATSPPPSRDHIPIRRTRRAGEHRLPLRTPGPARTDREAAQPADEHHYQHPPSPAGELNRQRHRARRRLRPSVPSRSSLMSPAWCGDWLAPTPSPRRATTLDRTREERGLPTGQNRGPNPGRRWGLSHGHGQHRARRHSRCRDAHTGLMSCSIGDPIDGDRPDGRIGMEKSFCHVLRETIMDAYPAVAASG